MAHWAVQNSTQYSKACVSGCDVLICLWDGVYKRSLTAIKTVAYPFSNQFVLPHAIASTCWGIKYSFPDQPVYKQQLFVLNLCDINNVIWLIMYSVYSVLSWELWVQLVDGFCCLTLAVKLQLLILSTKLMNIWIAVVSFCVKFEECSLSKFH